MILRRNIIVSYGLFIGWILSFFYNGPLLLNLLNSTEASNQVILFFFLGGLFYCVYSLIFKSDLDPIWSMGFLTFSTIIMTFFITLPIWFLSLISVVTGALTMAVSIQYIRQVNLHISFEKTYYYAGIVMLIGSTVSFIVYTLQFYLGNHSMSLLLLSIILLSIFSYKKNPNEELKEKWMSLGNGQVYLLILIVFLLKVGEGIAFGFIERNMVVMSQFYQLIYLTPYIAAIILSSYLFRNAIRPVKYLMPAAISLIGFSNFMLIVFVDQLEIASIASHIGYGILDVIIWGVMISFTFIYKNSTKLIVLLLISHMVGVLTGEILFLYFETSAYLTKVLAVIAVFSSIVLLPKVLDTIYLNLIKDYGHYRYEVEEREKLIKKKLVGNLTQRESEVLYHLLKGRINRDIGKLLNISETTVKTHCKNIYRKLNVVNKRELKALLKEDE